MTDQSKVAIIVGKAGSGKSTFLREIFLENWTLTLIEPTIDQLFTGSHVPEDCAVFDGVDGIAIDEVGRLDESACEKLRHLGTYARKQGKKLVIVTQNMSDVERVDFPSPVYFELERPGAPIRMTHNGQVMRVGDDPNVVH